MTDKIDKETAENEFERWADAMDLDLEAAGLDENDIKDNEADKQLLIKYLMRGAVIITEEEWMTFTPLRPPKSGDMIGPITWKSPHGSALIVMDKKKKTADVGKFYTSMGETCKQPAVTFSRMDYRDLKVCMAVYTLLMG